MVIKKANLNYYDSLLKRIRKEQGKAPLEGLSVRKIYNFSPKLHKDGPKKTIFENFLDIATELNREKKHLINFFSSELGSFLSLQNEGGLVMKGKFDHKGIENVISKYLKEYVLCRSCGSLETTIKKDNGTRLTFLLCKNCKASVAVNNIVKGYIAKIKRKK